MTEEVRPSAGDLSFARTLERTADTTGIDLSFDNGLVPFATKDNSEPYNITFNFINMGANEVFIKFNDIASTINIADEATYNLKLYPSGTLGDNKGVSGRASSVALKTSVGTSLVVIDTK